MPNRSCVTQLVDFTHNLGASGKTRKRHHVAPVVYRLGNHNLLSVASQNDLGIMVINDLNWKMHINQMICKANRILGLIRHTCNDVKDPLTRKILYWHMSDLFWNTGQKFGIHLPRVSLLPLKEFKGVLPDSSFKVLPPMKSV